MYHGVEPPRIGYNQFFKDHFKDKYRLHLYRNKLVNLQINSYQFSNIEPDMTLTFDENLEKVIAQTQTPQEIAKLLSSNKFPIRVIKDKNKSLHEYNDYLVINMHSVK